MLIEGINEKILSLPEDTAVYPGHGPATTAGREKRNNPFLKGGGALWLP
jgi:glyoxylase-like metal-dependent hydrolase (beta-lactamase superfamily II)